MLMSFRSKFYEHNYIQIIRSHIRRTHANSKQIAREMQSLRWNFKDCAIINTQVTTKKV